MTHTEPTSPRACDRRTTGTGRSIVLSTLLGPALLLASGCGGIASPPSDGVERPVNETHLTFEGSVIEARQGPDGALVVVDYDMHSLYEEANDYLRADDYLNALRLYDRLIHHFLDEDYVRIALYNGALALEGLGRFEEAAARYGQVVERWPRSDDAVHAALRRAECFAQLGRWGEVLDAVEPVRSTPGLPLALRIEGDLRRANALFELQRWPEAEAAYRGIIGLQAAARSRPQADPEQAALPASDALIAQAHFGRARVLHELFREVRMTLPEDRFRRDLIRKGEMLDETRTAYMEAVRGGNRYWSPAAGYMIGQLYEDFYLDVLATELPEGLDAVQTRAYFLEMRERLAPALRRAENFYRETLAMLYRIQGDAHWAERLVDAIERLERYARHQEGWDAEHELIRQGIHPRDARMLTPPRADGSASVRPEHTHPP